ncbi:MAG: hypothetical protein SFY80_07685 [Verrucomicrobiota bacterium]|nr:hypothetical protein [Verrucomicrobiota bacterium]
MPREARLMACAVVFDEWLAAGKVDDYAELSVITGMDRSRITRIMNYRLLEPVVQEGLTLISDILKSGRKQRDSRRLREVG